MTGQALTLEADAVVLSVGIEAEEEKELAQKLGVEHDRWGFFEEEHPKMKPLDLGKGVYVAGLAHSARFLDEALVQGQAAAMRAAAWLWPGRGTGAAKLGVGGRAAVQLLRAVRGGVPVRGARDGL